MHTYTCHLLENINHAQRTAQKYIHTSYVKRMEKSVRPIRNLFTPLSHPGFGGVCTDSETTSEFCLNLSLIVTRALISCIP